MTAYGQGEVSFDYGRITVEMTSLNRRHFELNLSLPRLMTHLEMDVRERIGKKVARGQVNLTVVWNYVGKKPVRLIPNLELAKELKKGWEQITKEIGIPFSAELLKESQLFFEEPINETISGEKLSAALDQACTALIEMKEKEGQKLAAEIASMLTVFREKLELIESKVPTATDKYRKKLTERMEALFGEIDERVLKEIALYAERIDISEEIVRAKSHLSQFFELLEAPLQEKDSKGKIFDFLCQELLRETNTIGAKASDVEVSKCVIEMKAELEKIREQVQNVE